MPRTLLLCFIHGFKGDDDTFQSFPQDLKIQVAKGLSDHSVESVVYPKYETKGELAQSTDQFLSWLRERVMDVRKAHSEKPWPPHDRDVGVVLVAHSMGGFVAADALFSVLNERIANKDAEDTPIFPLIQGILTFDTPYNGLARSMFVYGAFSNYQKVSSVFNVMTAIGAAAPAQLSKLSLKRATAAAVPARSSNPAWKSWQLIAVRTGTVGAIAAGGVTAYIHRKQIMEGMQNMRNINRESVQETVKEGYQNSVDAVGQGLAYINRGNVGKSFEYLSDHFTFIGSLMKQQELSRRLERMGELQGVGIHDFYTSLGENGVWSGGYFVPERTFCAIPEKEHVANHIFSKRIITETEDEMQAHMSMFKKDKNVNYEQMTDEATELVIKWFNEESKIVEDPKFAAPTPPEAIEEPVSTTEDGEEIPQAEEPTEKQPVEGAKDYDADSLPDESPLDIAAAASMVPLPDDNDAAPDTIEAKDAAKSTYMRYLFGVAQQAGTGIVSYVPRTMPEMPSGPSFKSYIPSQIPSIPSMPQMPNMPSMNVFSRGKKTQSGTDLPDQVNVDKQPESETTKTVSAAEPVAAAEDKS
ncbi:hypothetical protein BJ166DRAFT_478117 [Pestalotiopsis sp. NC0098]|nr:hypothetical protein BJ166DRAFT_478117 [Pestalotiopsis sp. NC0098]